MSSSNNAFVRTLVEMGFPAVHAEKAVAVTKNAGVEAAMNWLLDHADDPHLDDPRLGNEDEGSTTTTTTMEPVGSGEVASSYKCEECGKLLRDKAAVELHAFKSGHEQFAESTEQIKPLTEEEKKERLAQLKEMLRAKREAKKIEEQSESVQQEINRRKHGKDGREAQKQYEEQMAMKSIEKQKQEAAEDRLYREKLRAQLEQDKAERLSKKANRNLSPANAVGATPAPAAAVPAAAAVSSSSASSQNYSECRLQVRLPSGQTVSTVLPADASFERVNEFVAQHVPGVVFSLMTTFPRKVYDEADNSKSLRDLGLLPSCSFICKT